MHFFLIQISWGSLHSESGQLHGVEGRQRPLLLHLHFYKEIVILKLIINYKDISIEIDM